MSDLINREDAIWAVVNAHPMGEVEKGSSKTVFWVRLSDVAKALKALPSAEPSGDLISRADAKEARPEYRNEDMLDNDKATYNKGWNDCNDAWIAIIKALPSAEATCATCADRALCIMSAPDGNWKACKDYRAEAEGSLKAIKRQIDEHWYLDPPSAEAEWIPCSERLPSNSGNYLITVADFRLGHNGEYTVTMADFYAKAKKWNSVVDVLAWMPLPEPYREDGE